MRNIVLLGLLIPATLVAQGFEQPEPKAPDIFGETVDVLVVNIETVVTDREGNRVTGLTREDFRLLVDGEEMPIGYFSEIRDGRPTAALLEAEVDGATEAAASEPMPTNFLVFVDDYFSMGAHRNLVLEGLAEQLSGLGEKDRVAVVSFDGRRASMLLDWSGDPEAIRDGLEMASERRAMGPQRVAEARMFRTGSALSVDGDLQASQDPNISGAIIRGAGSSYYSLVARQIGRLVDAAAASLRGSLPPPGRKVALLVAGGWASGPTLELQDRPTLAGQELMERQPEIQQATLWYRPLVDTANLLGFTLYPIDAPGSGWGGPGVGTESTIAGFGDAERDVEYTLKQLARETGGRPLLNGLRSMALETAIADTKSYYWLGFNAAREGSGAYHDVRVEVVRPELRARSRDSFVDMSRETEARMTVEAGLILGSGEDLGDLDAEFSLLGRGERYRTVEALLEIRIPFEDVELLPLDGKLHAIFDVSLGARDKSDRNSDIFTYPVQMDLMQPPPPSSRIRIPIKIILRRERHDFVVTVRDSVGGNVFVRRMTFDPKEIRKSTAAADT